MNSPGECGARLTILRGWAKQGGRIPLRSRSRYSAMRRNSISCVFHPFAPGSHWVDVAVVDSLRWRQRHNQTDFLHLLQNIATFPRQSADPPAAVGCGRPHIQHKVCKIRNPSVLRSPQSPQTCEILWGDVRLFQEAEDFALVQHGVALFSGHSATLPANTRTLTHATECLVRSDARAQDAELSQLAAFLRNPRLSL